MESFSPLCLEGQTMTTAHPLLVCAELASSVDPRSHEAARMLLAEGLLR